MKSTVWIRSLALWGLAGLGVACTGPRSGAPTAPVDASPRAPAADTTASETAAGEPVTVESSGGPEERAEAPADPPDGEWEAAVAEDRPEAVEAELEAAPEPEAEPTPASAPVTYVPVPILPGALLPQTRIVAFYGNPASKRMGILGEVPPDEMLERLDAEVRAWQQADPHTPVRPALQIIAVMATGDPGPDSLYRLRMPDSRIRQVADWADRRDALLFLDVQPGRSTVAAEIQPLETWLARPDVHLALDPEWAMPADGIPGRQIGSMRAEDINHAIEFLAGIVDRYHLPPKVLVVHRFTQSMVRGADRIRRDPRVQVVMNMDGWGAPAHKRAAYRDIVAPEADQYTGFKLFFHNDRKNGSTLLTPGEILRLDPPPYYIQYQ